MTRFLACTALAALLAGCSNKPQPVHAKITEFKANPDVIAAGIGGKLCYGVENATKLDVDPPVETLLPASERCFDIAPKQTTTYTLTAYSADGATEKKSVEVKVKAPQPRVSDLRARPITIKRGRAVKVCFKVANAKSVNVKPGKLDRKTNCVTDYPKKTTTYTVTAKGNDNEEDKGTVTVSVLR
jgi:hypothetical protein